MNEQTIFYNKEGKPSHVMMSYSEYKSLQMSGDSFFPDFVAHDILIKKIHPIKAIRKWRKIKQKDLANQADITLQTMNAIENGRQQASLQTMVRLAKILDVKIDDLIII